MDRGATSRMEKRDGNKVNEEKQTQLVGEQIFLQEKSKEVKRLYFQRKS